MAKKITKPSLIETIDTILALIVICWLLVFGFIAAFSESVAMVFVTVSPILILYGLYLIGSAVYSYKELEILRALEKDTKAAEEKRRSAKPKLNKTKLIFAAVCIVAAILLYIIL